MVLFILVVEFLILFRTGNGQRATLDHLKLKNEGTECAACTIGLQFVERVSKFREISIEETLEYICDILPKKYQGECRNFVKIFGKTIVDLLAVYPPDLACQQMKFCKNPKCILFSEEMRSKQSRRQSSNEGKLPTFDFDKDYFSTFFTMRGTAWRGKDCADDDGEIYPGRNSHDPYVEYDYNCNGIFTKDDHDYQSKFCSGTNIGRGMAVLGDSGAARFRIPPQLVSSNVTASIFENLPELIENEFDWPHLGCYTGHLADDTGLTPGPIESIYLHLRKRNLCNHRDYQNIAVNGAKSSDLISRVTELHREPTNDLPVTVFVSLLVNDVCSAHPYKFTSPASFYESIKAGLSLLDTKLPNGSDVFVVGLIDGRVIADVLVGQKHPIGVLYQTLYDYLLCLGISPCWGYCNANETVRNVTWQAAQKLNEQYKKIVKQEKYKNFRLRYLEMDTHELLKRLVAEGYQPKDMIEPMDGFHPTQITHVLMSRILIEEVEKIAPQAFGNVNPYNEEIKKLFGDQGGY